MLVVAAVAVAAEVVPEVAAVVHQVAARAAVAAEAEPEALEAPEAAEVKADHPVVAPPGGREDQPAEAEYAAGERSRPRTMRP